MGCANYHAWLIFGDGERWLVRIPSTGISDVPDELAEYLVVSEYATLKFLETTSVPSARAFGFGLSSDPSNKVGLSFLLMGALPGKPYQRHGGATAEQNRHVLQQVADIVIELSRYPFSKAGSLVLVGDCIDVGETASNRFVRLGRHGPFRTTTEYFSSIATQYLELIADGQLHHRCPLEAYLFYTTLQSRMTSLPLFNDDLVAFYLKHADDEGDDLLVDDDYNIVGVVDWQFSRTAPTGSSFGSSLLTADLNNLYSGKGGISADDRVLADALGTRGSDILAQHMSGSDLIRRFQFGISDGLSGDEAREIVHGVLADLGPGQQDVDMESLTSEQRSSLLTNTVWPPGLETD